MEAHLDGCAACGGVLASLAPAPPPLLREAARRDDLDSCAEEWCERLWSTVKEECPPSAEPYSDEGSSGISDGQPLPFERNGEYKVLRQLGRGGMGVVYLARQVRVGRDVAVKVLPSRNSNSSDAAAWLRSEAQRLGKLDHPNIVSIYDADEQDGVPFFSMELVNGRPLSDVAHDNPMAPRRAAELVQTIARAVQYAHQVGVIHCDLKPANILVTAELVPKITDYGLATTLDDDARELRRRVAGTAEYMAPEQWIGEPSGIGPRTDVYGIGTILYELLVGRPPFAPGRERKETRQRVLFELPVPPRKTGRPLSRDLEAICMQCLEKRPDDRYQTAVALAEDLERFLAGRPVNARPVSRLERGVYFVGRNRPRAVGVLAVAITLCLAFTYVWSLRRHRQTSDARTAFETGRRAAEDGQVIRGVARMREALDLLPAGEPTWRRYFERGLASWESRSIRSIANLAHSSVVTAVAASPQGRLIAFGDATGATHLWKLSDNTVRTLPVENPRGRVEAVAFNSTGTLCAAGGDDSLLSIWNVGTGEKVSESRLDAATIRAISFFDSNGRVAAGTGNATQHMRLWLIGPGPDQIASSPEGLLDIITRIIPSAGGDSLVTITANRGCFLWDGRKGRRVADLVSCLGFPITAAAISRDGSTLAVGGTELALCDSRTGALRQKLAAGPWQNIDGVAFRRDGGMTLVARTGRDTIVRQMSAELSLWEDASASELGDHVVIDSTTGDMLISGLQTNRLRLWELPVFAARPIDLGAQVSVAHVAVSDDAARVVTLTRPKLGPDHPSRVEKRAPTEDELRQLYTSSIRIWNHLDTRPVSWNADLPAETVANCLALSTRGDKVAIGCAEPPSQEGKGAQVLVGSLSKGGRIAFRVIGSHGYDVQAIAFTADCKQVIAGSVKRRRGAGGELGCWNISGGCTWKIPCAGTVCRRGSRAWWIDHRGGK